MKKLLPVLVLGFLIFQSCKKIPVGFLMADYASYVPDSLAIPAVLTDTGSTKEPNIWYTALIDLGYTKEQLATNNNPTGSPVPEFRLIPEKNYFRNKNGAPWVGTPIQGLRGTSPIKIIVYEVKSNTADANKLKDQINIRGSSGIIEIPAKHGVAAGRYSISLRFSNEGWSQDKADIFTIIIE